MKLILNWKLAGEAQVGFGWMQINSQLISKNLFHPTFQGHFDSVKKKGNNDHLVDRGGQKKVHRVKVEKKDDYFEYWEQKQILLKIEIIWRQTGWFILFNY